MSFEIPPPPADGTFDTWAAMRATQQWTCRATLQFSNDASPQQVSDFLDRKPDSPTARFDTDFARRVADVKFPPDATSADVETWIGRALDSGLFVANESP